MTQDLTIPPDFRNPEIALLAAALDDGTREVRAELGEVSPEELAFTPMPGRHSAGAVLLHHASVEAAWIHLDLFREPDSYVEQRFPEFTRDWHKGGKWPDLDGMSLAEIYRRSDQIRQETLVRLATLEDPTFLTAPDDDGFVCTARWVIDHLIGHESYHFGQAVLLVELARSR